MITAEHWRDAINSVLDDYGLSKEEFWKDPKAFIDKLEDKDAKLMIEFCMSLG
jgi:ribosomal protein L12E/L44/L45/RPP1/RPP2